MTSYSWRMTDAMKADADSPARLLALAVIARWLDDRRADPEAVLGEEWIEVAEVPRGGMKGIT